MQSAAFALETVACGGGTCTANNAQFIPLGFDINVLEETGVSVVKVGIVSDKCFPLSEKHSIYQTLSSMNPDSIEMVRFFSTTSLFKTALFTEIDNRLHVPRWYWLEGFIDDHSRPRIRCHVCTLFWTAFTKHSRRGYRQRPNIAQITGVSRREAAWNRRKVMEHEKNQERADIIKWLTDATGDDMQYEAEVVHEE